jgi:flagellar L-ring protein precursor FlgH
VKQALLVCMTIACAGAAQAQSLLRREGPPASPVSAGVDPAADLKDLSPYYVKPPDPRKIQVHDKVTIIISETSRQSSEQKLDTKKDVSLAAALKKFPDLAALLEGELSTGDSSPVVEAGASANSKFKGDGKYERSDRFTDKITATVIDVKPNGVLVLEARRTIQKDKEIQSVVLSGECRREDVTDANTVLSSQLADLTLIVQNEGQVKDSATKGLLTRLFEAVFNF